MPEATRSTSAPAEEWHELLEKRYKGASFTSVNRSGIEVRPAYGEEGGAKAEWPGVYPYSRGIYPIHYQYQPWMDLQIIGYGVAGQLRERMDLLKAEGGAKGYFGGEAYNIIFDMPTSMGYDPDYPGVRGAIGDCGVSICKVKDYEILLAGKDLSRTHLSMVLNAGSPAMLGIYLAAARRMGFSWDTLAGNVTNYIWDFFGHCGGVNFQPRNSYRLCVDVAAFCAENVPRFNPITISEHNICEAGATNVQAVAFSIATIIALNEECGKAGISVDKIAPRYGFHMRFGEDFFEDIAKTRALRRLYAKINRERFGCEKPVSLQARIHAQTAGSLATVQQPLNNLIRNSYGALAAVLAGVNSMTVNAYDEALGIPTEEAVTLSLRTSQIISEEIGVKKVTDPLGGSHYIEELTSAIEERCLELIERIDAQGGLINAIESGWVSGQVTASAYKWRSELERGDRRIVGVNCYQTQEPDNTRVFQPDPEAARMALDDLARHRRERNAQRCNEALDALRISAVSLREGGRPGRVMASLVEAAEADATLGEMQTVLFEVFGRNK